MSYPVTGRNHAGFHDRLAIDTLQAKEKQFTLFILAYLVVQERIDQVQTLLPDFKYSPSSAAKFEEIAGIHGLPYAQYAGDPGDKSPSHYDGNDKKDTMPAPSRFGGYCNHGSVLFPTWHRPYVMLIEQAIGDAAVALAAFIEQKYSGEWIDDANSLRFPYWDWAGQDVSKNGILDVFCKDEVQILNPTDSNKMFIANPLSYYPFTQIPVGFKTCYQDDNDTIETAYFADWKMTLRHAASSPSATKSNYTDLNTDLKASVEDLRAKIARLFSFQDDCDSSLVWDEFSNHNIESMRDMKYHSGSLEGVHDSIHDIIGGNGHMSFPDYAGFDPIFFIHHSTVDRLFALWEWCYPDYWMNYNYVNDEAAYPWTQGRGTWFEVYNEKVDPDSCLAPFRNSGDTYWTPSQTRFLDQNSFKKYYSYPEAFGFKVDKRNASKDARDKAREAIQKYYGLNPDNTQKLLKAVKLDFFQPPVLNGHQSFEHRVFIVAVRLSEHAFNTSYSFRLHYQKSKNEAELIGSVAVFARPDYSPCKGCASRRNSGNVVHGVITIPPTVVDDIICASEGLNSKDVDEKKLIDGIKKVLKGRLQSPAGLELGIGHVTKPAEEREPLPSHLVPAEIELRSSAVARPSDGGPCHFYDWKYHDEIFKHGWEKGRNFPGVN